MYRVPVITGRALRCLSLQSVYLKSEYVLATIGQPTVGPGARFLRLETSWGAAAATAAARLNKSAETREFIWIHIAGVSRERSHKSRRAGTR